jgi:hypothetical protein
MIDLTAVRAALSDFNFSINQLDWSSSNYAEPRHVFSGYSAHTGSA